MNDYTEITPLHVSELARRLLRAEEELESVTAIERGVTSCLDWTAALEKLTDGGIRKDIFISTPDVRMSERHFQEIEEALRNGQAVFVSVLLPDGRFAFIVQGLEDERACVLHSWHGMHKLRAEEPQSIGTIVNLMKHMREHSVNSREAEIVRKLLWGADHAESDYRVDIKRISFKAVFTVTSEEPFTTPSSCKTVSSFLQAWTTQRLAARVLNRAGTSPLLGFVLSAGGIIDSWLEEAKVDIRRFVTEVRKGSLIGAASGAGVISGNIAFPAGVRKLVIPAGAVVTGRAQFETFALWDVYKWKMHANKKDDFNKRLASQAKAVSESSSGLGQLGSALCSTVGAVGGAIVTDVSVKQSEPLKWDGSNESVLASYAFFGFHVYSKTDYPQFESEEIATAFEKKLRSKPDGLDWKHWNSICLGTLINLLGAMCPSYKTLLKCAADLQKHKGPNLSYVCADFYEKSKDKTLLQRNL